MILFVCIYLNPFHWAHQPGEWSGFDLSRRRAVADCAWAPARSATERGCEAYRKQAEACKEDG